jgi:hypothetical protein
LLDDLGGRTMVIPAEQMPVRAGLTTVYRY